MFIICNGNNPQEIVELAALLNNNNNHVGRQNVNYGYLPPPPAPARVGALNGFRNRHRNYPYFQQQQQQNQPRPFRQQPRGNGNRNGVQPQQQHVYPGNFGNPQMIVYPQVPPPFPPQINGAGRNQPQPNVHPPLPDVGTGPLPTQPPTAIYIHPPQNSNAPNPAHLKPNVHPPVQQQNNLATVGTINPMSVPYAGQNILPQNNPPLNQQNIPTINPSHPDPPKVNHPAPANPAPIIHPLQNRINPTSSGVRSGTPRPIQSTNRRQKVTLSLPTNHPSMNTTQKRGSIILNLHLTRDLSSKNSVSKLPATASKKNP